MRVWERVVSCMRPIYRDGPSSWRIIIDTIVIRYNNKNTNRNHIIIGLLGTFSNLHHMNKLPTKLINTFENLCSNHNNAIKSSPINYTDYLIIFDHWSSLNLAYLSFSSGDINGKYLAAWSRLPCFRHWSTNGPSPRGLFLLFLARLLSSDHCPLSP